MTSLLFVVYGPILHISVIHCQDDVWSSFVAIDVFLESFIIISTHRRRYVASRMGFKQDSPNPNPDSFNRISSQTRNRCFTAFYKMWQATVTTTSIARRHSFWYSTYLCHATVKLAQYSMLLLTSSRDIDQHFTRWYHNWLSQFYFHVLVN